VAAAASAAKAAAAGPEPKPRKKAAAAAEEAKADSAQEEAPWTVTNILEHSLEHVTEPTDVAVDEEKGRVYVLCGRERKIVVFDSV
jgi:hypothetical protein